MVKITKMGQVVHQRERMGDGDLQVDWKCQEMCSREIPKI